MGYKPPHGRNPDDPRVSLDPFNHCGPLARSIRDLALMQGITAGPHPADPASLPDPPLLPQVAGDVSDLRIAWSADLSYRHVAEEVRVNTEAAVSALEAMGCACEQVELNWGAEIDEAASVWYAFFGTSRLLLNAVEKAPQQVSPDLRQLADAVRATRQHPERLDRVTAVIARMWESWERKMRSFNLFVCPTMGVAAVRADQSMWAPDFQINSVPLDPEFGYSMTHQFNMLSSCPVISMPSGVSTDRLPTGIQIVGRPYDEHSVFRLALALETRGRLGPPQRARLATTRGLALAVSGSKYGG
jgi:amidase